MSEQVSVGIYYLARLLRPSVGLDELAASRLHVVGGLHHVVLDAIYQLTLLALKFVALEGSGTANAGRVVCTYRRYGTADWFIRYS